MVPPARFSAAPIVRLLAVESSCDETAAAIIEDGRRVLASLVASQADLHAQFGGVFPEVASRQHIRTIYPVIDTVFKEAHLDISDVDAIAVTRGPGLPGSLVVGINAAKGLALASGKPLIGVNHLEGHIYSAWLDWPPLAAGEPRELKPAPHFPLVVLIVSGGHTEAGEAFDKVARLLELGYPGGPVVQKTAEQGDPRAFNFPRAWLENTWNFSFSGIKTAVLREVKRLKETAERLPVENLAASFQDAPITRP